MQDEVQKRKKNAKGNAQQRAERLSPPTAIAKGNTRR